MFFERTRAFRIITIVIASLIVIIIVNIIIITTTITNFIYHFLKIKEHPKLFSPSLSSSVFFWGGFPNYKKTQPLAAIASAQNRKSFGRLARIAAKRGAPRSSASCATGRGPAASHGRLVSKGKILWMDQIKVASPEKQFIESAW